MELYEEIRRDYEFGGGTIKGIARKLGVHRRMVRQTLADAQPQEWNFSHEHRHRAAATAGRDQKKKLKNPRRVQHLHRRELMRNDQERGRRAQRLASTKKLAGTLHNAASSDPKSHSFSTHPQSGEGWVEKLVKDKAHRTKNRPALLRSRIPKVVSAIETKGGGVGSPRGLLPEAPTDPDVRISRIRLFGPRLRYVTGEVRRRGCGSGYRSSSRFDLFHRYPCPLRAPAQPLSPRTDDTDREVRVAAAALRKVTLRTGRNPWLG